MTQLTLPSDGGSVLTSGLPYLRNIGSKNVHKIWRFEGIFHESSTQFF